MDATTRAERQRLYQMECEAASILLDRMRAMKLGDAGSLSKLSDAAGKHLDRARQILSGTVTPLFTADKPSPIDQLTDATKGGA